MRWAEACLSVLCLFSKVGLFLVEKGRDRCRRGERLSSVCEERLFFVCVIAGLCVQMVKLISQEDTTQHLSGKLEFHGSWCHPESMTYSSLR